MKKKPIFFIEKATTRLLFPFIFFSLFAIFGYAQWLELRQPPLDEKVAPFKDTMTSEATEEGAISAAEIAPPLEKPHRTGSQIQEWLSTVVSEAMTFEGRDYDRVLNNVRPYFTDGGFADYQAYFESIQLRENLVRSNYRAGIFFDQAPYVGKGFEFEGVYRWQARMPLTLSFSARDRDNIVNRNLLLDVQITRAETEDDKNLVLIESWDVKSRRVEQ